ncbi:MntP/YtaF family protein [Paenibacillus sp. y28]|uniref:MntP/YtaF family protein n=1 Tax=Paenibacillus sp. y28 TaxID=3129110 RepID=UPI003016F956
MLPVFSLLLLALAVSLDGLGVGVAYGMRQIRIPLRSVAIISCCSGLIIYVSMQLGGALSQFLSPRTAGWLGALILIAIGMWALLQMARQKEGDAASTEAAALADGPPEAGLHQSPEEFRLEDAGTGQRTPKILSIELKRLGIVIQILRTPAAADLDRSGSISADEALWLGVALSLDAFGAGIGAAFIGLPALWTSIVIALASGAFLTAGLRLGLLFAGSSWMRRLSLVPGFLLIIIGLFKLM